MVAISLYKGNLHKVPDVPRRWTIPPPKISPKNFRILLLRRSRALSRLLSSSHYSDSDGATTSCPSPASSPKHSDTDRNSSDDDVNDTDRDNLVGHHPDSLPKGDLKDGEGEMKEVRGEGNATRDEGEDNSGKLMEKTDASMEVQKNEENVKDDDKSEVIANTKSNTENASIDPEKRKKEVKEKLEILNEKKHSLVQVLKQILSAEEQLKRQNSTQGTSGRPPLQVDTTTDSGSMIKVNTPKVGPDGNPCGDVEGREADEGSNHNLLSCHLPRMSSTSPSSDSQQRKPASSMAPHSYRTTLGVAGSPSRFAPAGQGHSSVTVSATSYVASSPSPAASGGTSVFRDVKLPSPWN
ncbi:hypothetical protein CASFOL_015607 [Castilleja foliolosa]|uniref:Uncharacterized protein n=1 Tax=Castilleja foliolosa TaxID=1961234 RepID=A0ABD3DHN4_9LAMI